MKIGAISLITVVAWAGCRPQLDDRPWLVTTLQILGVRADPPEVLPGSAVTMQVVALGPTAGADPATTAWTLCRATKPIGENRVVAADCLAPAAVDAVGSAANLTVPSDACQLFGPDTPQPAAGAPPARPRDPDATGGYFQPVTAVLGDATGVALERITCGLPNASLLIARAYQVAYRANRNPQIAGLAFILAGAPIDPSAVPAGARVTGQVSWPADTAEEFPVFNRVENTVVDTREVLTASWYVTGGDLDRAAASIDDLSVLSTSTTWTTPASPASLEILVVLRDSRGGADARRAIIEVR